VNISLLMVTADGQSKELPTMKLPIVIGRAEDAKLRIPLAAVSRHHCELVEDDDELMIRDLKSSNGTFVNKERVSKGRELVPGDLISVGPIVFVVRIDGHPKAIDPIIAYASGSVATGDAASSAGGAAQAIAGVPTWGAKSGAPDAATPKPVAASKPAAPAPPAAKPAKKDDSSFESLLADLSESDFDIDLPDDDEPKKPAQAPKTPPKK
jgi:predicted component of type VI protein secretion system